MGHSDCDLSIPETNSKQNTIPSSPYRPSAHTLLTLTKFLSSCPRGQEAAKKEEVEGVGPDGGSPLKAERQSRRGLRHLQSLCSWGRQLPHFCSPALSPSAAASVHLHHSWRRVVPLKGRYRPQNCPRWCPLRLKWSRNPKRPPLGPVKGDLCFATQVWDLSPFQRWGKVGKLGAAAPPVQVGVRLPSPLGSSSSARREGAASSPTVSPGWELLCPRRQGVAKGLLLGGGRLLTTPRLRLGRPLEGASWEGREPEPGVKTLH
ncbi:unnamed protein product [Rangifer tarandus platyrhynchus]|uniref:Uncharacterized protein n=1 Tax=Rangifer tarandus platyrhynchus TaxID=3082113 RepID=A0AC60A4Z3_RANTA